MLGSSEHFPPPNSPPGLLTRIRIDKVGGFGPWRPAPDPPLAAARYDKMRGSKGGAMALVGVLDRRDGGGLGVAPQASAEVNPIGNLGETLRVEFKGIVADVTVHDVLPTDPPPGYTPTGSPRWRDQGGPWKARVTVHVIQAPNPFITSIAFSFDGVTPYADAYAPKNTDAPDALQYALQNAPPGRPSTAPCTGRSTATLVTNVVLINPQTGTHLAQWNIWQPGPRCPDRNDCPVATATEPDLDELADVAARTFPLACPPSATPDNVAAFIAANLPGRGSPSTSPTPAGWCCRRARPRCWGTPC